MSMASDSGEERGSHMSRDDEPAKSRRSLFKRKTKKVLMNIITLRRNRFLS